MQATTKAAAMSFTKSTHLDHIDFEDGNLSYCRGCDAERPFTTLAAKPGYVACGGCGKTQHAGNLILNGTRKAK